MAACPEGVGDDPVDREQEEEEEVLGETRGEGCCCCICKGQSSDCWVLITMVSSGFSSALVLLMVMVSTMDAVRASDQSKDPVSWCKDMTCYFHDKICVSDKLNTGYIGLIVAMLVGAIVAVTLLIKACTAKFLSPCAMPHPSLPQWCRNLCSRATSGASSAEDSQTATAAAAQGGAAKSSDQNDSKDTSIEMPSSSGDADPEAGHKQPQDPKTGVSSQAQPQPEQRDDEDDEEDEEDDEEEEDEEEEEDNAPLVK